MQAAEERSQGVFLTSVEHPIYMDEITVRKCESFRVSYFYCFTSARATSTRGTISKMFVILFLMITKC